MLALQAKQTQAWQKGETMETKGVTCKIPLDLHNRITEEIRQNDSTMSKFIEQIILEHYTKGVTTMGLPGQRGTLPANQGLPGPL